MRRALDELRPTFPPGVALRIVYDQSELVGSALGGVGRAVLLGAVLVVVVLFVLLGNLRAALLVTLTLPLSLALAGLVLQPLGVGINTMTLGGLAIAVGLLVDAAIIVTENIVHRLTATTAPERRRQALAAALEVGRPIAFATLIVDRGLRAAVRHAGIEGRMYRPLAAAVVAAVAASLVLALTLVPVLAALFLRPAPAGAAEDVWLVRRIKAVYAPLLDACMRRAGWCGCCRSRSPSRRWCSPSSSAPTSCRSSTRARSCCRRSFPPEASLDEVDRLNHRVEDVLREVPGGRGRGAPHRPRRAHRGPDAAHRLRRARRAQARPRAARSRRSRRTCASGSRRCPASSVLFTTPLGMRIDEGLGGTPADLSVRIFGPDLEQLARLGGRGAEDHGRRRRASPTCAPSS